MLYFRDMTHQEFQDYVHSQGRRLYRPMPWREQPTFYNVLVSELMLQQTQVSRVQIKFAEFMEWFPGVETLAAADLPEVLQAWQGLGYNRRARYLHQAAQQIAKGAEMKTEADLLALPGVGPGTAGAIMNYVYQVPTPFIETNIRTVYFNHFFVGRSGVTDRELLPVVAETMDKDDPRGWFWALMDYGTELKAQGKGKLQTSWHYAKQSRFSGSLRQMRGEIVRRVAAGQAWSEIVRDLEADERFIAARDGLLEDGLLSHDILKG